MKRLYLGFRWGQTPVGETLCEAEYSRTRAMIAQGKKKGEMAKILAANSCEDQILTRVGNRDGHPPENAYIELRDMRSLGVQLDGVE
jgi:hypothetical protein